MARPKQVVVRSENEIPCHLVDSKNVFNVARYGATRVQDDKTVAT